MKIGQGITKYYLFEVRILWKRNGLDPEFYLILFSPYLGENCEFFDAVFFFVQLLIISNMQRYQNLMFDKF